MMRIALLLCCLATVALGGTIPKFIFPSEPVFGRIVGGVETTIEDVPFQVVLLRSSSFICGGSILTRNVVMTAAHCTIGGSAASFSIRAGSSFYNTGGAVISSNNKLEHPRYNFNGDYDYTILYLSQNLVFGSGIQAIALPEQGKPVPAGSLSMTSGWGSTSSGGSVSLVLRKVEIPIVDQEVCARAYASGGRPITDRMICAGLIDEGGKDACQGDSGGPLVVDNLLVGVTSWGRGCALAGFPGVWARVPEIADWITENLN